MSLFCSLLYIEYSIVSSIEQAHGTFISSLTSLYGAPTVFQALFLDAGDRELKKKEEKIRECLLSWCFILVRNNKQTKKDTGYTLKKKK